MTNHRPEDLEMSRAKRTKTDMDPESNPYLAHHYENNSNGDTYGSSLSKFKRFETTAAQAHEVEDGPNNPFNNQPLSKRYFDILKTRRDLPVHKQR